MSLWDELAQKGRPSLEDLQAEQGAGGVPGNINLWAGVPTEPSATPDPTGAPEIRGKTRHFDGHWEKDSGGNYRHVIDRVWYE